MSTVAQRYDVVAEGFTARLEAVGATQWDTLTPCSDWSVRDLVAHVVGVHHRVAANVSTGAPAEVDPEGDLLTQWRAAAEVVRHALRDEALASTVVGGMFGEQSFESLVGRLVCADTLVHTWDLARATGQDEALDPEALAAAAHFLATLDDAIRRPGGFGPKIEPAPGADQQTRFLNFCGRRV